MPRRSATRTSVSKQGGRGNKVASKTRRRPQATQAARRLRHSAIRREKRNENRKFTRQLGADEVLVARVLRRRRPGSNLGGVTILPTTKAKNTPSLASNNAHILPQVSHMDTLHDAEKPSVSQQLVQILTGTNRHSKFKKLRSPNFLPQNLTRAERYSALLLPLPLSPPATSSKPPKNPLVNLPYQDNIKLAQLNVEDVRRAGKPMQLAMLCKEMNVDMLFMSETHSHANDHYRSEQYHFYFSSQEGVNASGVGVIISPSFRPFVTAIIPHSDRIMEIHVATRGAPTVFYAVYAPHQGPTHVQNRKDFWKKLKHLTLQHPDTTVQIIMGDINTRLQARRLAENDVLGPHIFGKGVNFIKDDPDLNRSLALDFCRQRDFLFANTFKQPNNAMRPTYRDFHQQLDDAMPPEGYQTLDHMLIKSKWLPVVKYWKSHPKLFSHSRHFIVTAKIAVTLGAPIKPLQKPPKYQFSMTEEQKEATHEAFNKELKKQINKTEVDVDSNTPNTQVENHTQRSSCPNTPYSQSEDHTLVDSFNNMTQRHRPDCHTFTDIYTDGSFKEGMSGWGYFVAHRNITAGGPVQTNDSGKNFIGASHHSNNTAELSGIAEALLWVIATRPDTTDIRIHYDSKYAAKITRLLWNPKSNRILARTCQQLTTLVSLKYKLHWTWVKGHSGDHGNDQADKAADRGREGELALVGRYSSRTTRPEYFNLLDPLNSLLGTPKPIPEGDLNTLNAEWVRALRNSADMSLDTVEMVPKQPYVKKASMDLITRRNAAQKDGQYEKANEIDKLVQKSIRKDKQKFLKQELLSHATKGLADSWPVLKRRRAGYKPKQTKLLQNDVTRPVQERAKVLAEHYANKQWAPQATPPLPTRPHIFEQQAPTITTDFTRLEFDECIGEAKKGKATGPDEIPADLLSLIDDSNRDELLLLFNKCWNTATIPDHWKEAFVVAIYKNKGHPELPKSYRPISLLNSLYKIYARLIQKRLSNSLEPRIRNRQHGFRKNHSTSDPIHTLRRLMELFEATREPLYLLFIDWEMAFDKITREGLICSLRRLHLPEHVLNVIENMYSHTPFRVRDSDNISQVEIQATGIRQGCPLSPYLFILFMSVLMHDVEAAYRIEMGNAVHTHSAADPLFDLEYADDTVLMSRSTFSITKLLHCLQNEAAPYGMALNRAKTKLLVVNGPPAGVVTFTDNSPVHVVDNNESLEYLGTVLNRKGSPKITLTTRLARAKQEFNKLSQFWSHANIKTELKVRVFRQIFYPMVLYGLTHVWLTDSLRNRLDAWHCRALRRIVRVKVSMISHVTNEIIYKKTNCIPISKELESLQLKYYGHVVRAGINETIHNVTYSISHTTRNLNAKRRPGRPCHKWAPGMENLVFEWAATHKNPLPPPVSLRQRVIFAKCEDRFSWRKFCALPTRRRDP